MNSQEPSLVEPLLEPLTRREREILALLAQGYSGPEIAEQLTLAISSVKWHIQHLYGKLGVNSKRQALTRAKDLGLLGTSPRAAGELVRTEPPPARSDTDPVNSPPTLNPGQPLQTSTPLDQKPNWPVPATRFFGREPEITQLKKHLAEYRLVTLTGLDGVGKTRLALRVAEEILGEFSEGGGWVELVEVTDPALVAQQIAVSLGLRASPERPLLETLTFLLRERQALLVLDNGESLLGAGAQLVDRLLQACPQVKFLVASHEPLGLADELSFPVPSLPFPDPDHLPAIEKLGDYAALSLLVDRARAALPDYQVTSQNLPHLARICQRLDGLPLALEMAAAGLPSLNAEALAARLDEAGGGRAALPRQQTLRVTVDVSYKLLSEEERLLLQRLSVFAGGFTLEAAEAVCAGPVRGDGLDASQLLDQLAWLAAKSMVMADGLPGAETRYRLRETVRQYAREKLQEAGEDEKPAPGEPPFKGLHYFDEADADLYFGREALIEKIAGRVRADHFLVVVVGASGSGKSSLVRAGLIPRLRQSGDYAAVHVLTPTAHPIETLALSLTRASESLTTAARLIDDLRSDGRALHLLARRMSPLASASPSAEGRLLIIVDQFEELFTLCHDEAERQAFIENLLYAVAPENDGPTTVVLTLRADFYAFCAPYQALREAIARHQEYIGPMSADELRRAIEEPAWLSGWTLEAGLVDTLLKDVGDEPGALPLLSHALLETWQRRRGRTLTLRGYAEAGGVRGAIAKTAESVYTALTPEQQAIARNIFLRLTELGEGAPDTRRRAALNELMPHAEEAEAVRGVLKLLADARLVTTDDKTAEVAHEALIREWPTLRAWLNADREGLRLHRQLTRDAQDWHRLKQDEGMLYRGARLAQAVEWAEWAKPTTDLNALEREFIVASQVLSGREVAEREAQQQRELKLAEAKAEVERQRAEEQAHAATRLRARNRVITGVGALAFLAAIIAVFFSLQSGQNANRAETNLSAAQVANTQSAQHLNAANENAATAEAASTQAVANQEEAQRQAQLARVRELLANSKAVSDQDPVNSLLLVVEAWKVMVDQPVPAVEQALRDALADPGGLPLVGHERFITALAFSPDGRWLATGSGDHTARLWDMSNPVAVPLVLSGHEANVTALAFSPDGKWLATGSDDHTTRLWDMGAVSADLVAAWRVLGEHEGGITALAFSVDGKWLVTGSRDATARLWDMGALSAGPAAEPMVLQGHTEDITVLAFSPDGNWLATGSRDNTARLWDMGALSAGPAAGSIVLPGHKDTITTLAFSPDGNWLATGSIDWTVRLWDLGDPTAEPIILRGHKSNITALAFSPDGRWLATGAEDNSARLWDMGAVSADPAAAPIILRGHEGIPLIDPAQGFFVIYIEALAFSADGKWLAMGGADNTTHLWDTSDLAAEPVILRGHTEDINVLAFSPDGRWLATGSEDHTTRIWDMSRSAADSIVLQGHEGILNTLAFSLDGKWLATGSNDTTARLWDMSDPIAEPVVLRGHEAAINKLAFSPDGRWLATGSADTTARLWDMSNPIPESVVLPGHEAAISTLAFSPDGRWLATGSWDNTARLWDISNITADPIVLSGHKYWIDALAFSPDGKWLATASRDLTARLWDMSDPTIELFVFEHGDWVLDLSFSPDGRWLATVTGNTTHTPRLWNLHDPGTEPIVLHGHDFWINDLAFSPDGRWLVTGGGDITARLWDMRDPTAESIGLREYEASGEAPNRTLAFSSDGKRLATRSGEATARLWNMSDPIADPIVLRGHKLWINALAFSPDGKLLATGSADFTARLWLVGPDALAQRVCQFAGRNFSLVQWAQYFPDEPYRKTCEQWPEGK